MTAHQEIEIRHVSERVAEIEEICWSVKHDKPLFGDVISYYEAVCTDCGRTVPFYRSEDEREALRIMQQCPCARENAA